MLQLALEVELEGELQVQEVEVQLPEEEHRADVAGNTEQVAEHVVAVFVVVALAGTEYYEPLLVVLEH